MPDPRKTRKTRNFDVMQCAGLGISLAIALAASAYAGYRLDSWLDTRPFLLITGCLVGLAAGMIYIVRAVNALQSGGADPDHDPDQDHEAP